MSDHHIEARGLARVETRPGATDSTAVLILEDTAQTITGYIINPEALNILLARLLSLLPKWADHQDLEPETLVGPQHALSAQRMLLTPGRSAQECAVRVYLGKVELTFLIPLDEVLGATANLKKLISVINDESESIN